MKPEINKSMIYDRQLRLWGDQGQNSLETANICLLNATVSGTESLKNLILPGIGKFTIVDDKKVTGSDVGSNFFLTIDQIGQSRAKCVTELLKNLNEFVEADYLEKDPVFLINENDKFFSQFNVIIASNMQEKELIKLNKICSNENIILVSLKTNGLFGILRSYVPEHTIIDAHPENVTDYRLDRPFQGLIDYCKSFDFSEMTIVEHSHMPFIVILYQCLEEFKSKHDGKMPSSYSERNELKEIIKSLRLNNDEENFDEAEKSIFKACKPTIIPSQLKEMFCDIKCSNINENSSNFWIIINAFADFAERHNCLPHSGIIPDMKSDTEKYVELQNIYRKKFQEDFYEIRQKVNTTLAQINRPIESIKDEQIITMIKNGSDLRIIRYRTLEDEFINQPNVSLIAQSLNEEFNNMVYYLLFRAVDHFYETHYRYPGVDNDSLDNDLELLKKSVEVITSQYSIDYSLIPEEAMQEIVRAGMSEIHTVSSLVGALVSQEILKLVTCQYTPMNNTCIFNGIQTTTTSYDL
ncbi:NEDD8-activating enzyme E1 regulatory subunit-like protein [Piromyces finnis]|uniref:NEDD8-activating enzyme E1 regulatory subunit n=1 Tax=Piromyces finnis TaxID=1754191 RepID=A0A1Y1VLI3_9FUNG|nr:NEDD8-activating enzyme E1 regulatory subunit-like protein [Piromyces finnis]|eukprot:ORX59339.1 NEDD8-activating enzyme E1 regulatory subunit-like protein [Piromyces finnis]